MTAWLVILGVAVGTYVLRASMFVALRGRSLPGWLDAPAALVGPAAVAALVASLLFVAGGRRQVPDVAEIGAVAAGFAAVARSGNVTHAFVAGLPVYWVLAALG